MMDENTFPVTALLRKFLDGTITEAESIELFSFLKEHPIENQSEYILLLQENFQQSLKERPALSMDASKSLHARIMATINDTVPNQAAAIPVVPVHRIHLLRRAWFRFVAAAVLLAAVSTAVYLFVFNNRKETSSLAGTYKTMPLEIPAGTDRAILQLENGQKILLDSTHGSIVQHGNLTVNNNDGKLDYEGNDERVEYHTLITPRGGQYKVQLPDGTAVWLNAASSITYPTSFNGNDRKVTISGEAYFEVAPSKEKPFIVNIDGKATVEVLGTHFNINAYTDEPIINTTLLEGMIKMLYQQQAEILSPGQQAQISQQVMKIDRNPDLEMVMAWKNGTFWFNRAHLPEVLRQFSRWYEVDVVFEPNVPDIVFSGEIKRDLNLSEALTVLERLGVRFKIDGRKLTVTP